MATILQKNLADNVVKNIKRKKPLNKKELVASSGYGKVTAQKHATEVLEQKGVLEELAILGFNVESAKKVVGQILLTGENDNVKLKASEMIFKVHGTFAPEKSVNLNVDITGDSEALKAAEMAYLQQLDGITEPTEST